MNPERRHAAPGPLSEIILLSIDAIECLPLSALLDLGASPFAQDAYSPLSASPCVLVDLRPPRTALTQDQRDLVAAWIQRQSCPVIAITDADGDEPLARAFDVIAADETDARLLIRGITRAPIAAMTLVQVLRATAAMPVQQALLVESLAYSTLQSGPEFQRWLRANPPTPLDFEPGPALLLERAGPHLRLRLNRPARRNAVSVAMRDQLVEALQLVAADTSIREVTISGNGACFCVGGELAEFGSAPDPASAHAIRSQRLPAVWLARSAQRLRFHLHSACIGAGMEMPAFGRHVSAARNTFFQLPELRFGLIPGAGGCVSLPRRIGRQRTAWLVLSGKKINASTALAWGLVDALSDAPG